MTRTSPTPIPDAPPAYVFDFPPELLRTIFELAASHPPSARALTLTSVFARAWVEPILYRTAHLATPRQLAAFHHSLLIRSLRGDQPGVASPRHVQRLAIMCQASPARTEEVIRMCEHVQSLACGFAWQIPLCPLERVSAAADPAEETVPAQAPTEHHLLGLACRNGLDVSLVPHSTTHLRVHITCLTDFELALPAVLDPDEPPPTRPFVDMSSHLPHLTHLAVVYRAGLAPADKISAALAHVLEERPSIEVALMQVMGAEDADVRSMAFDAKATAATPPSQDILLTTPATRLPIKTCDARLVVERPDASFSAAGQWDDQARFGGVDGVWENSRAVVAARHAEVEKLVRERQAQR